MAASETARNLAVCAAKAADKKMASNIAVLDVSDRLAITECFVIAGAETERQVNAIVEEIEDALCEAGRQFPVRREGTREGRWSLLDYGEIVVHVFREQEREFYGLDRLWRDCPLVEVPGIAMMERPADWADEVDIRTVETIEDIPLAAALPADDEI